MARRMGMVCYVLAGLMLVAALIVPVVGFIAGIIVWAWGEAASASNMTIGADGHEPAGFILELALRAAFWVLDVLGPIPTILVVILTIVVEIGLILGAVIFIFIGRRLRRRAPVTTGSPAA